MKVARSMDSSSRVRVASNGQGRGPCTLKVDGGASSSYSSNLEVNLTCSGGGGGFLLSDLGSLPPHHTRPAQLGHSAGAVGLVGLTRPKPRFFFVFISYHCHIYLILPG